MANRLIQITTALAVLAVAAVVTSYRHTYEFVHNHGETGPTARLAPFTVEGLV